MRCKISGFWNPAGEELGRPLELIRLAGLGGSSGRLRVDGDRQQMAEADIAILSAQICFTTISRIILMSREFLVCFMWCLIFSPASAATSSINPPQDYIYVMDGRFVIANPKAIAAVLIAKPFISTQRALIPYHLNHTYSLANHCLLFFIVLTTIVL